MRFRVALIAAAVALLGPACLSTGHKARERGGGFGGTAPRVESPPVDRCTQHGTSSVRASCDEARYLGQTFVRRLAPGDQVCLEGGFGEGPGSACLARAAVVDAGTDAVLLEIREAQPPSRWFRQVMSQIWYEEGALVDLYLAERGY